MQKLFLILISLFFSCLLQGQDLPVIQKDSIDVDSLGIFSSDAEQIESEIKERKTKKEFKGPMSMFAGKPGRAALYSLVLPGAGQFYNKKYWKVPFVWAAEGVAIGILVYNIRGYRKWNQALSDIYSDPIIFNPLNVNNQGITRTPNEVLNQRNKIKKYRDYSIISVTLIHLIQVADAFVNRHLIEFDVSDDLSFEIGTPGAVPSLSLIATF